ncbi:MAG: hypothetical protein AAGH81_13155, partial [Bacteroidota bacterium]
MKPLFTLIFISVFCFSTYSQKKPPYFPQEVIVSQDCEESGASDCLYEKVEGRVKGILIESLKKIGFSKDTLTVLTSFSIDKNGFVNNAKYTTVNDSLVKEETKEALTSILNDFQPFEVLNK